jgi:ABC-2 type transport system permease protein
MKRDPGGAAAVLALISRRFQASVTYRASFFVSFLGNLLFVYVMVSIWTALYGARHTVQSMTLAEMRTYVIVANTLRLFFTMPLEANVEARIRQGDIALDMLKPMDFQLMQYADVLGRSLFNLVAGTVPVLLISWFAFGLVLPPSPAYLALFLVSVVIGHAMSFLLAFITAVVGFWTTDLWGVVLLKTALLQFFSGLVVPLTFFPPAVAGVLAWLPFQALYYVPQLLCMGKLPLAQVPAVLGLQVAWLLLLFAFSRLLWTRAVRKLALQGG